MITVLNAIFATLPAKMVRINVLILMKIDIQSLMNLNALAVIFVLWFVLRRGQFRWSDWTMEATRNRGANEQVKDISIIQTKMSSQKIVAHFVLKLQKLCLNLRKCVL